MQVSSLPLFWSYPTALLGGSAAAGGIALIGLLGNLAGFVSPYTLGYVKDLIQSTDVGIYVLAGNVFISAILAMTTLRAKLVNR